MVYGHGKCISISGAAHCLAAWLRFCHLGADRILLNVAILNSDPLANGMEWKGGKGMA